MSDSRLIYSVSRKLFAYIAILAIAFTMLPTDAYADTIYITDTEFYAQVKGLSNGKVDMISGGVYQGFTTDQTNKINSFKNGLDLVNGNMVEWFAQGDNLDLGPTYYAIYKRASGEVSLRIRDLGGSVGPYLDFITGGTIYDNIRRRIETDGTENVHSYSSLGIQLSNPSQVWTDNYIADNGMDKYMLDEEIMLSPQEMPVDSVFKTITVPAGYAVSFYKKTQPVYDSSNFNFYTDHKTGVPVLVSQINKGTYYNVQNGYPTASNITIGNYQQIPWTINRNAVGLVQDLSVQKQVELQVGQSVTFFNPLMHFYAPTQAIQNGPMDITYSANGYAVKLHAITTSDQSGFIVDGITDTPYQPYDPLPSDESDTVVEIVDSTNPDYIDTTDPNYVEPDPEDEDYTPPPTIIPTTPPTGGNLGGQEPGTFIPDEDDSIFDIIKQTLDGLAESIRNIMQPGIGAIQSLVQSGSSFMQAVGQMFTWLPSEVTSVISSALILFIVIGVVKLLV